MIPVDYNGFQNTLKDELPPSTWPTALKALWYDAKGNWNAAHDIAQELPTVFGSWIHAYLHRKEGDRFNAAYWYDRAGRAMPELPCDHELRQMVEFALCES